LQKIIEVPLNEEINMNFEGLVFPGNIDDTLPYAYVLILWENTNFYAITVTIKHSHT